jgi:Type III restriction enzyme, res subunit
MPDRLPPLHCDEDASVVLAAMLRARGFIQSLVREGAVDDLVAGYGQVIVDECHHVPAVSFERVLSEVKACFITGLTATYFYLYVMLRSPGRNGRGLERRVDGHPRVAGGRQPTYPAGRSMSSFRMWRRTVLGFIQRMAESFRVTGAPPRRAGGPGLARPRRRGDV